MEITSAPESINENKNSLYVLFSSVPTINDTTHSVPNANYNTNSSSNNDINNKLLALEWATLEASTVVSNDSAPSSDSSVSDHFQCAPLRSNLDSSNTDNNPSLFFCPQQRVSNNSNTTSTINLRNVNDFFDCSITI